MANEQFKKQGNGQADIKIEVDHSLVLAKWG